MTDSRGRAWAVHCFTASGSWAGVLALHQVYAGQVRLAFWWMMVAVFIDCVDGSIARRCQVERHAPEIDGRRLDDMVDFFTWVVVPSLAMGVWNWLPSGLWALPILASALGMANREAKTEDDFFLGFPSLWNLVALYLWQWQLPVWCNGLIVAVLSAAVLLPIRFVYPSKTRFLRPLTVLLMGLWGILVLLSLLSEAPWAQRCFDYSNVFPLYYCGLSLFLHIQQGRKSK